MKKSLISHVTGIVLAHTHTHTHIISYRKEGGQYA